MSMAEASGALLLQFYDRGWPSGYYHEHWDEGLFGSCGERFQDLVDPEKTYPLSACGVLLPFKGLQKPPGEHSFEETFNAWLHKTGGARTLMLNPKTRQKEGIPHDPKSICIVKSLQKIDSADGNYFDWRIGGEGDNGEKLLYQLDVYFFKIDHQLLTLS